jgi:hypothetical protein
MEPEVSLPRLQEAATCPYPGPDQSSPCLPSYFLKTHFKSVSPSKPGSSKCSLSLRFTHQNTGCSLPFPRNCYMPCPSHSSRFVHPHIIWWEVHVIQLLIILCIFLHSPVTSSLLCQNIHFLFSNNLSLRSSPTVTDHVSHPYKQTQNYISVYLKIIIFR